MGEDLANHPASEPTPPESVVTIVFDAARLSVPKIEARGVDAWQLVAAAWELEQMAAGMRVVMAQRQAGSGLVRAGSVPPPIPMRRS